MTNTELVTKLLAGENCDERQTLAHANAYTAFTRVFPMTIPTHPTDFKRQIRPAVAWKRQATKSPAKLKEWFGFGLFNVACTPDRGYIVLDEDGIEGAKSRAAFEARYGQLPETPTQRTPSGGKHYWFTYDPNLPVRNQTGTQIGAPYTGVDLKVPGDPERGGEHDRPGCLVMAPSIRPDGCYSWINWDPLAGEPALIAPAPQWVIDYAMRGTRYGRR